MSGARYCNHAVPVYHRIIALSMLPGYLLVAGAATVFGYLTSPSVEVRKSGGRGAESRNTSSGAVGLCTRERELQEKKGRDSVLTYQTP